ncbi:MAG: patatin-like phospholipase family protein [Arcobacteraceae bacterium]
MKTKKNSNKKIALCLGGGGVLGAYHIGVLKAVEELNIKIDFIAGTSIGSIIGALYAAGKSAQQIEEIALHIKWKDFYNLSICKLGLLSNEKIGNLITKETNSKKFKDLIIPFGVVATDISKGEKVILKKGNLQKAVMASSCVPGVFIPVEIQGKLLVDGGIVENVPISVAQEFEAEYIIAVDLNSKHSYTRPKNAIEVLFNSFEFLSNQATSLRLNEANLVLEPNLEKFNSINTKQIKELINKGYKESLKILQKTLTDKNMI